MLLAVDLCKSYAAREVLHSVSFDLAAGAITGLLGPNGAGKSTLLHILVGLSAPTSGMVLADFNGEMSTDFRSVLGFCPDDLPLPDLLTGKEYLDLVAGIRRLHRIPAAESSLLEGMRLGEAMSRLIGTYSHGMKRKLQLVAALLHRPRILILDEPFRGLDPESSAILKSLLRIYASRGHSVLVSTHDLLVAEQLCDEVLVLRDGTLLANESVDALRGFTAGGTLEQSFLKMTGLDMSAETSAEKFFEGLDLLDPVVL